MSTIARVIWQYWETKDVKPYFIDELRELAIKNSGSELVLVGPDNINEYLPDIPKEIFEIQELAHKADMIRALLIYEYGGMWLDSDAIVLSDFKMSNTPPIISRRIPIKSALGVSNKSFSQVTFISPIDQ